MKKRKKRDNASSTEMTNLLMGLQAKRHTSFLIVGNNKRIQLQLIARSLHAGQALSRKVQTRAVTGKKETYTVSFK